MQRNVLILNNNVSFVRNEMNESFLYLVNNEFLSLKTTNRVK